MFLLFLTSYLIPKREYDNDNRLITYSVFFSKRVYREFIDKTGRKFKWNLQIAGFLKICIYR